MDLAISMRGVIRNGYRIFDRRPERMSIRRYEDNIKIDRKEVS
jgi:hypothetical protein